MELDYTGKIYGKVSGKYFDTGYTTKDFDKMQSEIKKLKAKNKELQEYHDEHEKMFESGDGLADYIGGL